MEKLLDPQFIEMQLLTLKDWVFTEILVLSSFGQLVIIAVAFLVARMAKPKIDEWISKLAAWKKAEFWFFKLTQSLVILSLPLVWIIVQWFSSLVAEFAKWPHHLLTVTVSLLTAWIIIRLTSVLIRDKTWAKMIATAAWIIAALNIVNLLDPTIAFFDSLSVTMGDLRVSALTVIKGIIALAALLWLAQFFSRLLEQRISQLPNITPSVQVLFTKLFKIVVITIAIVVAMSSVGIDLTAFAVFSGAVGVGIGFGLQKIFSNLISGLLILADKSVKPGDVIEVAGTYGWINTLGGRYASVITRDGVEHLIPNEELISQRVSNWTYSDTKRTCRRPSKPASKPPRRKCALLTILHQRVLSKASATAPLIWNYASGSMIPTTVFRISKALSFSGSGRLSKTTTSPFPIRNGTFTSLVIVESRTPNLQHSQH